MRVEINNEGSERERGGGREKGGGKLLEREGREKRKRQKWRGRSGKHVK